MRTDKLEVFRLNQTLHDLYCTLHKHLEQSDNTYMQIYWNGDTRFQLRENGDSSWYWDELIFIILTKVSQADPDIVKFAVEHKIPLYEVTAQIKTPSKEPKK